ncbi:hypothetical protein J6590_033397 [Homalodisca vitripennis]|nr:hypothetical protein J6590_033397 [Homalodisca vitripennis]
MISHCPRYRKHLLSKVPFLVARGFPSRGQVCETPYRTLGGRQAKKRTAETLVRPEVTICSGGAAAEGVEGRAVATNDSLGGSVRRQE